MKKIQLFIFFLLYRYHLWIFKGQPGMSPIPTYIFMLLVLSMNFVVIFDIIGLPFGIHLGSFWIPESERSFKRFFLGGMIILIPSIFLCRFRLLEKAESETSKGIYQNAGFRNWHALLYTILSFFVFIFSAYLKGQGVY